MATPAHAIYCFEVLSATFEHRKALSLRAIEELWNDYVAEVQEDGDDGVDGQDGTETASSIPRPMFVTWNTRSRSGDKRLRGCIGTFEAQEIEHGLKTYAQISAFEDRRFNPISARELSSLDCEVTFLTDFEDAPYPMAWDIGTHGLRISFTHKSRRYSSTYLPHVASEQGWNKVQTLGSLMRKAGWNGKDEEWQTVPDLHVVRYQGRAIHVSFEEYRDFKAWLLKRRQNPAT